MTDIFQRSTKNSQISYRQWLSCLFADLGASKASNQFVACIMRRRRVGVGSQPAKQFRSTRQIDGQDSWDQRCLIQNMQSRFQSIESTCAALKTRRDALGILRRCLWPARKQIRLSRHGKFNSGMYCNQIILHGIIQAKIYIHKISALPYLSFACREWERPASAYELTCCPESESGRLRYSTVLVALLAAGRAIP